MHRDRRRAGRAIRKRRRLAVEKWERFTRAVTTAADAYAKMGAAMASAGTAMASLGALAGHPSQSGVTRAREAHSPVLSDSFNRADGPVGGGLPWE